jgi:hypothetical protein
MPDLHELVAERSTFFANRVDTYARLTGYNTKTVVQHLLQLSLEHGEQQITGIIDKVVPADLHSSKMPAIIHKHYGKEVQHDHDL